MTEQKDAEITNRQAVGLSWGILGLVLFAIVGCMLSCGATISLIVWLLGKGG